MWTITGPFDGEVTGDVSFHKTKLLKPGKTYTYGRKGTDIIINNKRVSHQHGVFQVFAFSSDDAVKPSSIPTLIFTSAKKNCAVRRPGDRELAVNEAQEFTLQSGDEILLLSKVSFLVKWEEVCVYPSKPEWKAGCIALGIHIVPTTCPEVTHHLTTEYAATADIATSLISSAQLVKPEWLKDLLSAPLESTFSVPSVNKYRPAIHPSLDEAYKRPTIWEPNEERLHMFRPYRFLCVGKQAREVPLDLRNMIDRGDGGLECFDIHSGVDKFRRAIQRGRAKQGKKLLLVGDEAILAMAIGKDVVQEFVREARTYGMSFIPPDTLVRAVLDVDTSQLEVEVPTTYPEEPSQEPEPAPESEPGPPPKRRLLRRPASREPSATPEVAPPLGPPPTIPRLRRPTRRPNQIEAMVTGLDDPSSVLDSVPDLDTPIIPSTATPARPLKLKRPLRHTSAEPSHLESVGETFEIPDSIREPPLKKFKALFEASDPDRLTQSGGQDTQFEMTTNTGSITQTETAPRSLSGSKKSVRSLDVLREEEEESMQMNQVGPRTLKRRAREDQDEDIQIIDVDQSQMHPAKRRATESQRVVSGTMESAQSTGAPQPHAPASAAPVSPTKLRTKGKSGAETGKPDIDADFLKAIASTKKGKKKEDEFDRQFNELKISKPEIEDNEPEKEWAVLAEFGDDTGLRGNFMNVLEIEVFKEKNGAGRVKERRVEWDGKPNFKKFKKKDVRRDRPHVELFVTSQDEGLGPAYWKGGPSSHPPHIKEESSKPKPKKRAPSQALSPAEPDLDDSVELSAPPPAQARPASRAASKPPSRGSLPPIAAKRTTGRRGGPEPAVIEEVTEPGGAETLFLDDSEDDPILVDADGDGDEDETLDTFESKRSKVSSNKKGSEKGKTVKKTIVKEDTDHDAVFKGFGRRRR